MKKLLLFFAITMLILNLSACGKNNKTSNKTTASDVSENGSKSSQSDTVVVPDVVRLNINDAKQKLSLLKLTPVIEYVHYIDKSEKRCTDYNNLEDDGLMLKQDIPSEIVCFHGRL